MEWFRIPQQKISAYIGILLSAYFIYLGLSININENHWLNRLDFLFYDTRFNTSLALSKSESSQYFTSSIVNESKEAEHTIVILDIDEKSLANEGRWPWSRHKLAELVSTLAEYGVVVVAFDVVFSEPERNPVNEVNRHLENHKIDWKIPQRWREIADGDQGFARHISDLDVVLGYFFQDEVSIQVGQLPSPIYQLSTQQQHDLVTIEKPGYAANLAVLQQAAAGAGFVSTFADADGVIRRSPLVIRHGDSLYPSLSLATIMSYLFVNKIEVSTLPLGNVEVMTAITAGGQRARTDVNGQVIIPYRGRQHSFPYISVTDVLQKKVDLSQLEGAIVLVGTTAIGLADLRTTPVGNQYPGVEVHANIIRSLLSGEFPYRPEWEAGLTLSILVFLGGLLSLWLPRLGPVAAIILSVLTLSIAVTGNFYLWHVYRLDLPIASICLLILVLTVLNLAYGYLRESASKRLLKGMFNQYVPQAHIDRMLADPEAYQFSGESKELTVLFADIRSFTTISEHLSAADLKSMLNQYFTPITKIIFDHEGTIDKYVGDMVMAFWGAPLDDKQHAHNGILSAIAMQKATLELSKAFVERGLPEIKIGIGLNTGIMNVGDMGSSYRRAYTVLGDAVNLGSRLESITKFYGAEILVGERTAQRCPGIAFSFIDRIQVKGKDEAIAVYKPLGLKSEATQQAQNELSEFTQAYICYLKQSWQQALALFQKLQLDYPNSSIYKIYLDRIENLRLQPTSQDWDGVFRHTSK
ncbi:MAG: adenylate/guanylate cyclase domain-containing protein [Oleispira sp.]|nr:adenylate/guanylate cyclase domain-containing protein [Oleispira sp.]